MKFGSRFINHSKNPNIFSDEDGGIEMQVLGDPSSRTSAENNISNDISQANSAISIDFPEQMTSTIGWSHSFSNDLSRPNRLFRFRSQS